VIRCLPAIAYVRHAQVHVSRVCIHDTSELGAEAGTLLGACIVSLLTFRPAMSTMKPEALDAIATQTMRPKALDAATMPVPEQGSQTEETKKSALPSSTPSSPNAKSDVPQSVGQVVDGVVNGVKSAIDGVISWAEEKVEGLSAEQDNTGPYSSPALCAPSDLDPIASGILPAMPSETTHENEEKETKNGENVEAVKKDDTERKK
ncbi:hypothetical protein T440DRAFT_389173, partial [Plenodomus tracheiphilus IPT5]